MIELTAVGWRYRGAGDECLRGVDLSVAEGETVLLCGASGSGKSTMLRVCNGLIPHFHRGELRGTATVAGLDVAVSDLDGIGRRTGAVFQNPRRQFFADRVSAELVFASENFRVDPLEIGAHLDETIAALHLDSIRHARLLALSGGQQQRVAIGAAAMHRPDVLLLDEPTANLSAEAVDRVVAVIAELKRTGTTIVIAEHRLARLAEVSDRVVVADAGRLVHEWSGEEFSVVDDRALAARGLRSTTVPRKEPAPATASGASIVGGSDSETSGGGLVLSGVKCSLGGRAVLEIDHALFPRGEVTVVSGVNGAGKSTLGRLIAGLQPYRGAVRLDGGRLARRSARLSVAMVQQDVGRQLFFDSVEQELRAAAGDGDTDDVSAVLAELGLDGMEDRHPLSLSGGQQQRLVMASVATTDRPIIVLDEPSTGVDRRGLDVLASMIAGLADRGRVVVVITHDDELTNRVADRRLTLKPLTRAR